MRRSSAKNILLEYVRTYMMLYETVSAKAIKTVKQFAKIVVGYINVLNEYNVFEHSGEIKSRLNDITQDLLNDDKFDAQVEKQIKYTYEIMHTLHKIFIATIKTATELLDDEDLEQNKDETVSSVLVNAVKQHENISKNDAREHVLKMIMNNYFKKSIKQLDSGKTGLFNAVISMTFSELETITKKSQETLKSIEDIIKPVSAAIKEIEKTAEPETKQEPQEEKPSTEQEQPAAKTEEPKEEKPTAVATEPKELTTKDAIDTVAGFLSKLDKTSRRKVALAALKRVA